MVNHPNRSKHQNTAPRFVAKMKTMKFTHRDLAMITKGMALWHNSGEYTQDEWEQMKPLLVRLREQLGNMNWDARQNCEPTFNAD